MRVIAEIVIGHFLGYFCYLMFEGPVRSLLRPVTGEKDPLMDESIGKVTGTTMTASSTVSQHNTTGNVSVSNVNSGRSGGGSSSCSDVNANLNAKKAN